MSRFSRLEFDTPSAGRLAQEADAVAGTAPRTATEYLHSAHDALRRGSYDESLQLFTRCLREDRARIPAWVGQVQMLIALREYHEALLWSGKALELFKNNGDLLSVKAQAHLRLADRSSAVVASDAAIKVPGSGPFRWQVRGEIMLGADNANARRCFERSINEPDADWFDRVRIAEIYLYHQQPACAIEWARAAAKLEPGHGYVYFTLGVCQDELGLNDDAARSFIRSLELLPSLTEARTRMIHLADRSRTRALLRRMNGRIKGWFRP